MDVIDTLSIKNQEKVLSALIKMVRNSSLPYLYRPKDFQDNFAYLSEDDLDTMLCILEDKGLISVVRADYPDSFGIGQLYITAKGYDYHPQKVLRSTERWKERFFGFVFGVLTTVVATVMVSIFL